MDEKTVGVIRDAVEILLEEGYTNLADELESLLPREETLEEAVEELLDCGAGKRDNIVLVPDDIARLRAALERRRAGK